MHQSVYFECLVDEYLEFYHEDLDQTTPRVLRMMRNMARNILRPIVEYADDGSDPIQLADIANSELDFLDWWMEEEPE